jgi:hypothetical protein
MEATVVKEEIVHGRVYKTMSDGRTLVELLDRAPGTTYGTHATIKGEATDEKLAEAKEMVVEDVCRIIREIANEKEEIFIIKPTLSGDGQTVGLKFILPTVEEDDYSRYNEGLIVE